MDEECFLSVAISNTNFLLPVSGVGVDGSFLVLAHPDSYPLRFDARLLDKVWFDADDSQVVISIDGLSVGVTVAEGIEAARRIVRQLAPFARMAPITRADVYEDAKARMVTPLQPLSINGIQIKNSQLHVAGYAFQLQDVKHYADHGANVKLPNGRSIQAALALISVAIDLRAMAGEDRAHLAKRIARYEREKLRRRTSTTR